MSAPDKLDDPLHCLTASEEQSLEKRLRSNDPIVGPRDSSADAPTSMRMLFWPVVLLAFLGLGLGFGIVDSRRVRVERIAVPCRALPPQLNGYSIIQLSDLHSVPGFRRNEEVARLLEGMQANLMVITGDFRNSGGSSDAAAEGLRRTIRTVRGRMPIYVVQGNNDWPETMQLLRDDGIDVLDNRAVSIAGGLWLAGWNPYLKNHPRLAQVIGAIPENAVLLLASHSPDVILEEGCTRAQLIMSGHTHGIQVRIPGLPSLITLTRVGWRYTRGLYSLGGSQLYINRGIGTSMVPLRVYSPPEISVLQLRPIP